MKKVYPIVAVLGVVAGLAGSLVYGLEAEDKYLLNNRMGAAGAKVQLGTKIEQRTKQVVRVVYDASVGSQGLQWASAAHNANFDVGKGSHALGTELPANSIITRSWFHISSQLGDSASGPLEIYCGERGNIIASTKNLIGLAADTYGLGETETASLASVKKIPFDCEVQAVVHENDIESGKAVIFVEHVVSE